MPEYAGRQSDTNTPEYAERRPAATPLNYGDLTGGLIDILKETEKKRNDEKARLDEIYQSADTDVRETAQFENQNLQTLVHNAADKVRDQMYDWNKELKAGRLKPKEYQARLMQAQTGWSMFANSSKTYDDTMKNFLARQQPGEDGTPAPGSKFEGFMASVYAGNADLSNTELISDYDSGKIFMTKYDNEGNISSTFDVSRMGNPGNMIDNRFNLSSNIDAEISTWEKFKIETGTGGSGFTTIEDVRNNTAYQLAVDAKVQSIIGTDRFTASVLADNGAGYDYYQDPEDKRLAMLNEAEQAQRVAQASGKQLSESELLEIAQAKGDRMIQVKIDGTGTMQPVITDAQRKAASDLIKNEIEIKLGRIETKTAAWKPESSGGGSGGGAVDETTDLYPKLAAAWNLSKTNRMESAAKLSAMTGDDTEFRWEKGGLQAYKPSLNKQGGVVEKYGMKLGGPVKSLRDLDSYFYGQSATKGQAGAHAQAKAERLRNPQARESSGNSEYKGDVIIQNGYEYKWNPKTKQYE